ncbi:MAG: ATP-binding protein [Smithella sp.]|jgi:type II secretory pathway predicted ATPase ExeA
MKDLLAWFGLKRFPFDKNIKTADVLETDPFQECFARLEYIKRRGGILLLTGDPGVGKTLALRRFVDSLNENLFKPFYTPLSTLSRADLLYHINRLIGLPSRISKSAIYTQIQAAFLESSQQAGKTILLIIDEAHLLQSGPLEELRLLTNFKMDSGRPVHPYSRGSVRSAQGHGVCGDGAFQSAYRHPLSHARAQSGGNQKLCDAPSYPRRRGNPDSR